LHAKTYFKSPSFVREQIKLFARPTWLAWVSARRTSFRLKVCSESSEAWSRQEKRLLVNRLAKMEFRESVFRFQFRSVMLF
jgi:hypothetical protein